jgi:hypothetical protein
MMPEARRHHAHAPGQVIVFVGGSPEPLRRGKPAPYPVQHREAWRPRTKPPNRKAEALIRLLDGIRRNDEIARAMLTPRADLVRKWLARAA